MKTNYYRRSRARLRRYLILLVLVPWALWALHPLTIDAQTDPGTLRSRADYLGHAAERCQGRIDSGELDECTVLVTWERNREISIQEARAYAARLTKSACILDSGISLNDDLKSCKNDNSSCFEHSGIAEGPAYCSAACLAGLLTDRTWAACLTGCGIPASRFPTLAEHCISPETNCKEKALRDDKRRRRNCP